uniref:Uncharacterized protein n=1 Tax=Romanomermis culicivorax TaxID=13658 RepID=A0A915L7T1_ROMCU
METKQASAENGRTRKKNNYTLKPVFLCAQTKNVAKRYCPKDPSHESITIYEYFLDFLEN